MKIDVDEVGPVQRKIRVELPPEAVADEFSRAYKTLGQRVRVRGFRTGKIPRNVLQGIYGEEIKGQVRSHLVEESLGAVIRDRSLQIVSRPEIEANDLEEGHSFSFSALVEVKPDIPVKNYLGIEVERVRVLVTDDQVAQALRRLQESHARLELVEGREIVQRGDFVTVDFEGTIGGRPFPGAKGENYLVEVGGGQSLPQFEDALVGLRRGEPRPVQVLYPEDYPTRDIAGKSVNFSVLVREIKQKVLPPLDDDFAKDHGECGSLDELKAAIHERLEAELKQLQNEELKEQILNRLIEAHSLMPPPSMVDRQTRYLMERYQNRAPAQSPAAADERVTTEATRRTLEARATRQVQATLLVEKIAQLEKIEITDPEVQERVDHLARAAGDRAKTVREIYSRPGSRDDLRAQLLFDRTVGFLLEQAKVKEVEAAMRKVAQVDEKS
ncbi:MAG TPA: trigger factor [Candidatus Binatia bacterium]|nr:trigger factor [Candidatus Binatia bacterium]